MQQPITFDTSFLETMHPNVAVQFWDRVAKTPQREAFRYVTKAETWESVTWAQSGDSVAKIAGGLLALGLQPEMRVGLASSTRYEWILADMAVMAAAGATTTVYPTTHEEDTAYILADSECRVVFAEDDEQVKKLVNRKAELPYVAKVVTFEGTADGDWIITLDELVALGQAYLDANPGVLERIASEIAPDQLATLVYTSGTTGRPKGVRLVHRSWVYEGSAIASLGILSEDDLQFLWLPMAHVFGKVLLSTQMACGFATAIDGRVDKIVDNLAVVQPTFMGAAPRIFEKAYSRIITMQEAEGGLKEKIFTKAFAVGREVEALKEAGKPIPGGLGFQHKLFDKLVYSKIRARFGGRVRFFISGAAALNSDIAQFFNVAGIQILEGYGLTEVSAGAFVNHPDHNKFGTVGFPFPGTEVKLGPGDEVLVRGPGVMEGYHNLPEATAKELDAEGWFHTGDKGSLDELGRLSITGRIKELFKTSGGKYVAPPAIEAKFKAVCPYASQFMVFGAERNYCVALVTLDPDAIAGWAQENGHAGKSYTELVNLPEVQRLIDGHVQETNAALNRWETVKKWRMLDHDLTIESGELTPSMKVKRNVVENNYSDIIEAMYAEN
ncbi:AMP-dependent synthetase/ligase [Nocardioides yefusunii]|uniref:Acyl-CoA synthetase n=1 Tax=Nocardioides yefusunii TaxID=2500546 RepID=A0ABW1QXL1_9ACTN|nr:long-chain fatty acid--CoA ligase [Nocardioides yefusunii]